MTSAIKKYIKLVKANINNFINIIKAELPKTTHIHEF